MVDERHLRSVRLSARPRGQIVVGTLLLRLNYGLPPRTRIRIEGLENLPRDRRVLFALNHTDRYNYWPFQYQMWRTGGLPYTASWVKAKYYRNRLLRFFFDACNNIPLPSRGYLVLEDARQVLGRALDDGEYRALRDLADGRATQASIERGGSPALRRVLTQRRRDFDPDGETYADFIARWNDRLMGLVEARTAEALFRHDCNVIVFPQGTRSIRLLPGHTGLAQFALRHDVPVVPVGSNGSERVYPSASPWARGGAILYRVGRPLTTADELADCRIAEPYAPFTQSADRHRATFERATARITARIDELLDAPYRMAVEGARDGRSRAAALS
jgi:1-acyl-sn-glycerol-3-phosphate acyltransferase